MKLTKIEKSSEPAKSFVPTVPGAYLCLGGHLILIPDNDDDGQSSPIGAIFFNGASDVIQPLRGAKAIKHIKIVEIKYMELP